MFNKLVTSNNYPKLNDLIKKIEKYENWIFNDDNDEITISNLNEDNSPTNIIISITKENGAYKLVTPLFTTNPFTLNESSYVSHYNNIEDIASYLLENFDFDKGTSVLKNTTNVTNEKNCDGDCEYDRKIDNIVNKSNNSGKDTEEDVGEDVNSGEDTQNDEDVDKDVDKDVDEDVDEENEEEDQKKKQLRDEVHDLIFNIPDEERYNYDRIKIYIASPLLIITYSSLLPHVMFYFNIYFYFIAMLLVNFGFGTFLYFILLLAAGQYYHLVLNFSPMLLHLISFSYICITNIFAPTLDVNSDNSLIGDCYIDGFVKSPIVFNINLQNSVDKYWDFYENKMKPLHYIEDEDENDNSNNFYHVKTD